jgi:hypothetical protein
VKRLEDLVLAADEDVRAADRYCVPGLEALAAEADLIREERRG